MGAKKGEIIYIVYRRRNRASVDQPPCREDAEDCCTSSAGNLKTSPSPRGPAELRVVPSRFNDSVVDAQTSQGRVEGLWKSSQYCGICKRSWHSSDELSASVAHVEQRSSHHVNGNSIPAAEPKSGRFSALPVEQSTADCRILDQEMMLSLLEGKFTAQVL
ncbi:hypothetical protein F2Q68_00045212 [Brassica cretica]|uniref:Uncharacterized protein n=1 Tax=Brassica cretica TaxID=69181 RepID=A0A8S9LFB3_BRACR|nr:hypothetical protein F2Q68_00045212 [Brassica cretica]